MHQTCALWGQIKKLAHMLSYSCFYLIIIFLKNDYCQLLTYAKSVLYFTHLTFFTSLCLTLRGPSASWQVHQYPGGADPVRGHTARPSHRLSDAGRGHPGQSHPRVCCRPDGHSAGQRSPVDGQRAAEGHLRSVVRCSLDLRGILRVRWFISLKCTLTKLISTVIRKRKHEDTKGVKAFSFMSQ